MNNEKLQKLLLIISGIALIPIGLSYGIVPEVTLTGAYGFPVDDTNLTHIFRAQMGLCLGQAILYLMGAFKPNFRSIAMVALIVFMLGLGAGRALSFIVDGTPAGQLTFSLIAELIMGFFGLYLYLKEKKNQETVS